VDTQYSSDGIHDALKFNCATPLIANHTSIGDADSVQQVEDEGDTATVHAEVDHETFELDRLQHIAATSPEVRPPEDAATDVTLGEENGGENIAGDITAYAPQKGIQPAQQAYSPTLKSFLGWFKWPVAGDQRQIGPVFKYARVLTHDKLLQDVATEFERATPSQARS
jgi:hypothetical protein